jgi:hypothetical protein
VKTKTIKFNLMKKIYLGIAAMTLGMQMLAQCLVTVTGSTNVNCFGSCNGTATLTTIGTPPFTYSWSSGQTVQNPTNLCAGTFTVTMTDASACVTSTTVTITQPPMIQDSTDQQNIAACDSCNGTATVYPYGGTAPFTHKWSTNPVQTTAIATGLCPGTYIDSIRDFNGCMFIDSVTITQPGPLSANTTVTDASSFTSCDGGAFVSPSGGNGPYTYMWSPGNQTTQGIIGQCPGTYTVCVTDSDGCSICDSTAVIAVTGINDIYINNMIHVSPNPSSGLFTIACDNTIATGKIMVINILGEVVFESTFKNLEMKLDLSHLSKGNYVMRVNCERGIAIKRLVIQ